MSKPHPVQAFEPIGIPLPGRAGECSVAPPQPANSYTRRNVEKSRPPLPVTSKHGRLKIPILSRSWMHVTGAFIIAQRLELCMAQVAIGRPFVERNLSDNSRLHPSRLRHFFLVHRAAPG